MSRGLSRLQCAILDVLKAVKPSPCTPDQWGAEYIGHLPTSGQILEALGRDRTNANYAAVSKALRRLEERRLIVSHRSQLWLRGKALRYALPSL